MNFDELLKPITDALNEAAEHIKLVSECEMRRFYIRDSVGDAVIAEGVIFSDGSVAVRWKIRRESSWYLNFKELENVPAPPLRGYPKIVFLDPEVK